MSDTQEKKWLGLAAAGDERAFRYLYDQYGNKVYTMAISYLKSPLEAQDVVQDIFLKVWEKRSDLSQLNSFPAWLHVLTRNYLINSLQKKIPTNFQEDLSKQDIAENRLLPAEQLDVKEMAVLIQQAVNSLSPRQQQVYRLSRESGMTLNKIASELGLSYDTIREHMNNALRNIRVYLKDHYGEIGLLIWFLLKI